ncbi:MAG TPA: dTDP-4-dehydrorhamnose 3,5-epimerase [Polyangiaceae bacterium]|jgi:dTDP-4-dehydrorhamnose 3,5-epimerase|nr:dTDP-4-dehydrorhamnose 3,5-epimerase [Polyangiaceae bacterium]
MQFIESELPGAYVIELERHLDERGFFARSYCEREFREHGLPDRFPQCNLSRNNKCGTLRGMHFDAPPSAECKLVRCVSGAVYDVILDLRPGSSTRFRWTGVQLSAENGRALFVPAGFAHGFLTLTDASDVFYHMGDFFKPETARGFRWDDPYFGITWPSAPVVISERDAGYSDFDPGLFEAER